MRVMHKKPTFISIHLLFAIVKRYFELNAINVVFL